MTCNAPTKSGTLCRNRVVSGKCHLHREKDPIGFDKWKTLVRTPSSGPGGFVNALKSLHQETEVKRLQLAQEKQRVADIYEARRRALIEDVDTLRKTWYLCALRLPNVDAAMAALIWSYARPGCAHGCGKKRRVECCWCMDRRPEAQRDRRGYCPECREITM